MSFLLIYVTMYFDPYAYAEKAIILTFDDDWKGQFLYVKPILDRYGFKATFFVTCNCVTYQDSTHCNNSGKPHSVITWQDIKILQNDGHDIQSHGMSHKDLTQLTSNILEYEIGQSKQCMLDNNINSNIFANAFSTGWDNSTVIDTVAKYYDMARAGYGSLTYLKCNGWNDVSSQTDCRTYFDNRTLTFANRYSIRTADHNYLDRTYMHNSANILEQFIEAVNSQNEYNNIEINAIPVIVYHNVDHIINKHTIDPMWINSTTDVSLFDKEMKYLHDNGFRVLTMSDLGYNKTNNHIYIRNN